MTGRVDHHSKCMRPRALRDREDQRRLCAPPERELKHPGEVGLAEGHDAAAAALLA